MKKLIKKLQTDIPNIYEYYSKDEITRILSSIEGLTQHNVADAFMDAEWEKPIRRCSACGKLQAEGYVIGIEYACCDACRNEIYKQAGAKDDNEAYRRYLLDCFEISEEDVKGLSNEDIEDKYRNAHAGSDVYWTQWY